MVVPPHTTVDTDESCDKSVRIFERVPFIWHFFGRRLIPASGCIAVVWSDVIKHFDEVIELLLLCAVVTAGGLVASSLSGLCMRSCLPFC